MTKVSDFYSVRQWHSIGMYTDYYRPYGIEHLLGLVLPAGHTNAQIAWRLGISEGTVRIHLQNIYARLQVSGRTAAVTKAFPSVSALVLGFQELDAVATRKLPKVDRCDPASLSVPR